MRACTLLLFAVLAPAPAFTGCGAAYSGDGRLTDHGWLATPRYELDLGSVDLTSPSKHLYYLVGLPDTEMVIGLETIEAARIKDNERVSNPAVVLLELKNSDQTTVVSAFGPLNSWVWSYGRDMPVAFLYMRGEEREVPLGNNSFRLERVGANQDGGWGTYFTPTGTVTYTLALNVVEAQPPPQRQVRLLLRGGGWK